MDQFNIEIVEFYPKKPIRNYVKFSGTLHIYIADYDMDLRGIEVKKEEANWWIQFPNFKQKDLETSEIVEFPFLDFGDHQKKRMLVTQTRQLAKAYIIEEFIKKGRKI